MKTMGWGRRAKGVGGRRVWNGRPDTLQWLGSCGVFHNDIKPSNIYVDVVAGGKYIGVVGGVDLNRRFPSTITPNPIPSPLHSPQASFFG